MVDFYFPSLTVLARHAFDLEKAIELLSSLSGCLSAADFLTSYPGT